MASQANSGSDLGFEADLFKAADKLRGNLEPSEYKHVALGLILRAFYQRLVGQGKAKKVALVGVARKVVTLANTIVSEDRPWQPRTA
jgi:hypothetical protein